MDFKKLVEGKIGGKTLRFFLFLIPFQLIFAYAPVVLFFKDESLEYVLMAFEIITVPVTVLVFSLYFIQRLQWGWLKKNNFTKGFITAIVFGILYLLLDKSFFGSYSLKVVEDFVGFIFGSTVPIALLIIQSFGWIGKWAIWPLVGLYGLIVFPVISGVIVSLAYAKLKWPKSVLAVFFILCLLLTHQLTLQSFGDYLENMKLGNGSYEQPENFALVETIPGILNPCPPQPDGPCGFDLQIWALGDWNTVGDKQIFYFAEQTQVGLLYFGPFKDDLKRIIKEGEGYLKSP